MRSVTTIIVSALVLEALAKDSQDRLVDELFDKVLDKLYSRAIEASSLHDADLDQSTLGKTGSLAATAPSSRISAVPTFRSSALPVPRMSAPHQLGVTWQSTPQMMHRTNLGTQLVPKAAVVDENCDPEKMVCVAEAGQPHGGNLVSTYVESEEERKKMIESCDATIEISERQACDVSLLITGGLSPLSGFMKKADYDSVVKDMRLADGTLMGLPVVLDVKEAGLAGKKILLKYKDTNMAVMDVEEEWEPDKKIEAEKCYGTSSDEHPTAAELYNDLGKYYVGGKVSGLLQSFDVIWGEGFKSPAEVRKTLPEGKQVVAFQNRNPVHKAHFELLVAAKEDIPNSIIFVHPTCGPTQPGDIDGNTRIKTYEVLQEDPFYKKWAGDSFRWSYLPYSMKMAGPREAIQHMIIRKNFGATHFIIGRDMAGTKSTKTGDDFYGPFDAQLMGEKHAEELAMKVAKYPNMVYVGEEKGNARGFASEQDAKEKGLEVKKLSGTKFRDALRNGEDVPDWFAFPEVVKTLQKGGDGIFIPGR